MPGLEAVYGQEIALCFQTSRPALRQSQPPVKSVAGDARG
jgi:hypothetical protein